MDITNYTTKTYEYGDYLVDIVTTDTDYESWIQAKGYGTKHIMFGMPKEQQSLEEFMNIVEANIEDYTDLCEEE